MPAGHPTGGFRACLRGPAACEHNHKHRIAVIALALLLTGVPASAQDSEPWARSPAVGLGPLMLRAQSPLAILRLTPIPLPPETAAPGEWDLGAVVNWNNYFDVNPALYTIDAESVGLTLGAAVGLTSRLDVNLALPVSYRGGGILDGFVEAFERTLGVPNQERTRYPRNQFLILIHGEDGKTYERSGAASGWGLEDATTSLRYQIAPGTATSPALLAALSLKLPIGRKDSLRSTGGVDVGLGISAAQRLGRFNLYGTAAYMRYAEDTVAGIDLRRHQWSLFSALEFRKSARTSYLLQATVTSPSAARFGDFAKNTYEVTLGFKHRVGKHLLLEASVLENLFIFDNSPDVGFHVGYVWRTAPGGRPSHLSD